MCVYYIHLHVWYTCIFSFFQISLMCSCVQSNVRSYISSNLCLFIPCASIHMHRLTELFGVRMDEGNTYLMTTVREFSSPWPPIRWLPRRPRTTIDVASISSFPGSRRPESSGSYLQPTQPRFGGLPMMPMIINYRPQ